MGLKGAVRMGAVDGLTVQRGAFRHSRSERAVTVTWGCNITGRTGFERLNASPTRPTRGGGGGGSGNTNDCLTPGPETIQVVQYNHILNQVVWSHFNRGRLR